MQLTWHIYSETLHMYNVRIFMILRCFRWISPLTINVTKGFLSLGILSIRKYWAQLCDTCETQMSITAGDNSSILLLSQFPICSSYFHVFFCGSFLPQRDNKSDSNFYVDCLFSNYSNYKNQSSRVEQMKCNSILNLVTPQKPWSSALEMIALVKYPLLTEVYIPNVHMRINLPVLYYSSYSW